MSQTQISMDEKILASLDSTSVAQAHSRDEALKEAIQNYVEYDRWHRAKVEAGIKAARAGRVVSGEAVRQHSRALLDKLRSLHNCQ